MTNRSPVDVCSAAIEALAAIPIPRGRMLREVAGLAIAMNQHEESYRAAGVDRDEIEEGVRTIGRLAARTLAMGFPPENV